jgi:GntR family transcriptional regulator
MPMQPIDKKSTVPYYDQLAELLRHEIAQRLARGETYQLPSENELAESHGISRQTVRHALDELERDGWIYRQKGVGSFAVVRRVEQELAALVSTSEAMRQRGWHLETQVLEVRQLPVPSHVATALEIPAQAQVYEVTRLRIADGAPVSLQTNYLPAALCPRLEENDLSASLYRLLESRYGLRLWHGQETLRAAGATSHEAHLLAIKEGAPVMRTERITYAANGAAVEYLDAVWRGDRYDFKVKLTRP